MKKIPTLFERVYENHKVVDCLDKVTPGMEWVLEGKGIATLKYDGSCCAIIDGKFYKRYDAKKGKKAPEGAIPCCEPDQITGHHPHWVRVDKNKSEDKWFVQALVNSKEVDWLDTEFTGEDGTYEAVGPHFQGNPYDFEMDVLIKHGCCELDVPRTYEGIKKFLEDRYIEGIVFWLDGEPKCKIKRSDFGFGWNNMKKYNIYEEGFRATGEFGHAQYVGSASGETFLDACKNYIKQHPKSGEIRKDMNGNEYACCWGCRWFPTLEEARKSFG